MFEDLGVLNKVIGWLALPVTGALGIMHNQNKRNIIRLDLLDDKVADLTVTDAVSKNDIQYIKQSVDKIVGKLEKIEDKINDRRTSSY